MGELKEHSQKSKSIPQSLHTSMNVGEHSVFENVYQ